jgi:hypothetical protein
VPESQDFLASHFLDNMRQDHHLNVNQGTTKTASGDAKEKEFNFTVNVLKQPRGDYAEQLLVPTTPSATKTKKRGGR